MEYPPRLALGYLVLQTSTSLLMLWVHVEEDRYNLTMKICTDCNKEKVLNEFYTRPDVKSGDGYQSYCIECCKSRKHKWYEKRKYDFDVRYKNLKSGAKQRNLELTISFSEYSDLMKQNCHYCNASLEKHIGTGLDRKINNIGYTKENSVPCCTECNVGKGEFYSYEEWIVMIKALLEFREKNGREQQTRTAGPQQRRPDLFSKQS